MFSTLQFYVILLACCTVGCCPPDHLKVLPLKDVDYPNRTIAVCELIDTDAVKNKPTIKSDIHHGKYLLVMVQHPKLNATHSKLYWMAHVDVQKQNFFDMMIHFEYTAPQVEPGTKQLYVMQFYKDDPNLIFTPTDVIDLDKLETDNGLQLEAYFAFIAEHNV